MREFAILKSSSGIHTPPLLERDAVPDSLVLRMEREVAAAAVVCNLFFSLLSV